MLEGLRWHLNPPPAPNRLDAILGLVFLLGWACSAVGLRLRRATGDGPVGAWLLAVQAVGLFLAASQQIQGLTRTPNTGSLLYRAADTVWPSSVLFMLVIGAFTVRARVLVGCRFRCPE
ncbi:MAG: hypothetical protein EHM23_16490 [Acidobacteria bacterium]|nr:MAG: hypothetical protein EHM23_16490 [Acidobacteriota bacterium]